MRADRLVSALLFLQAKGSITAAQLAAELEISVRTARRDLEALSMSGIPVYPQPGRGGGWRLLGGAKTDLTGLTGPEAQALFLAIGASAATTPALGAAMSKLAQALPETFRDEARAASSAVVVDAARWGRPEPDRFPAFLEPLQRAIVAGWQVRLGYAGQRKPVSVRVVHPLGLVTKAGVWYLIAAAEHHSEIGNHNDIGNGTASDDKTDNGTASDDKTDNGTASDDKTKNERPRTFRVSRITSVELLDRPLRRPTDFDLEASWAATTESFHALQNPIRAVAIAEPWTLPILHHVLGKRLEVGERNDDGNFNVKIVGPTTQALAGELAGFGTGLVFDSPASVQADLAKIGQQLTKLYSHQPL